MLEIASQIILCLVLAALLGFIIGYLFGKSNCPKEVYQTGAAHDPHTEDSGDCDDEEENDPAGEDAQGDPEGVAAANTEAQSLMGTSDAEAAAEAGEGATSEAETAPEAVPEEDADRQAGEATDDASSDEGTAAQAAPSPDEESAAEENIPSDDDKPAALLDAPRDGQKDNLTRIKGIGVKIDALLNSIGVYHFDQIAAWTEKEAAWIDHKVSFPGRSVRDDWVGQARMLAEGKETEFSKRVDKGEVASSKKS